MKLQDLTLAELREIDGNAPEGANSATYTQAGIQYCIWSIDKITQKWDEVWGWHNAPEFYRWPFIKLSDIRARIDELEPADNVTRQLLENPTAVLAALNQPAGHRIDTISAEMASPCTASDSAKNKAQMDLQENEPDIITAKLDPKKCRIVDPALPYDEPNEWPLDVQIKPNALS